MSKKITAPPANERDDLVRHGLSLTEATVEKGGFADFFSKNDSTDIEDPVLKAHTAVMLENASKWMGSLDESTLALTVGGYRDYVLPIVRASFPTSPINQLVSVQPMNKRNGTVYWLNYVIGQTRGDFKRGQTLFDANNGWQGRVGYTDEQVSNETLGTAVANATQTGTLSEIPVRAGSVEITVINGGDTYLLRDNNNGGLTKVSGGALTVSAATVNYVTGAVSVTFSSALSSGGAISANYTANGEGTYVKPQLDLEIQSTNLTAIRRAIGIRVSMEAMQDMKAEFGSDTSEFLISGASQQILTDQAGHVLQDLWAMAGNGLTPSATFDKTVPTGVNRAEHFRDINYEINIASGAITDATQRGEATWLVVDQNAANVLLTAGAAGGFIAAPSTSKGQGLVFLGTFNGLPTYKYKFMSTFPNAAAGGNILVGYKGSDWFDTGYVLAPFQQFYSSGPDNRADMTMRQSFAMRYSTKIINSAMYRQVALTGG